MFSKKLVKLVIQSRKFPDPFFFQSISCNSLVVAIQIYFSPIFVKLWVHASDNIAGVERGPQYY